MTCRLLSGPVSGLLSQTYNTNFVVEQQLNGSPLSLAYNADLQPTAIGTLALTYNSSGRLAGTTLGSVSATFLYDTYGELTQRRYKSGGVDVFVENFRADDGGRIVSATENIEGVAVTCDYAYDTVGRLTDVFVGGAPRWHYEYDGNSNRIAFDDFVTNESASGTYDAQDRLLDYGGATFTYTANGELLTKTDAGLVTSYDYDVFGNLDAVTLPDGHVIEYLTDARDRRVAKVVDGVMEQGWLYQDGLNPVAELDASGQVVSRFVYGTSGHVPTYMLKDGAT